jgi:hypothetical protein
MKLTNNYFPLQTVSDSEKAKPQWYENCIDYIIAVATACNDRLDTKRKLEIFHGNIPNEFYKKTLNPYNSANEKNTRFPATMRNLDLMNDVVRRYISEYIKGIHEFIVTANNPEIVLQKDAKLREAISLLAQQTFVTQLTAKMQEQINQGVPQEQIDPTQLMPNVDDFIKDFNDNYIDDVSAQGQDLVKIIDDITNSDVIYPKAYFDFVTTGECYSYRDVRNGKFIKEIVPVLEAYPIPNDNQFVKDHDMFARRRMMSYQQVVDNYREYLTAKDLEFLRRYYDEGHSTSAPHMLNYNGYFESYPDSCSKFSEEERRLFKEQPINVYDKNTDLIEVWHVVWRGEKEIIVLTYQNEAGLIDEVVVDSEDFVFDPNLGHISYRKEYRTQVYEGLRIGLRTTGIYPLKARAVCFNRNGELPYNGILELLPNMGKFSIVDIITPYQILRNIISYHREMVIAKNKMLILIIAESLLGSGADDTEDKIYKMAADGLLAYDDSDDSNSLKAQQIRLLNANMSGYIQELTNLMDAIKYEAREMVDMTPQRYGEIAQSAGQGTTQEAIIRGSMGSVIVVYMFDKFREADYQMDLDFTKLAWIDGLQTTLIDNEGKPRYISVDINAHLYADYLIRCKNNAVESEKVDQLKDWAFSAAQNGDLDAARAAITNSNVASINKAIDKFMEIKRNHELEMQQAEQQIQQAAQEFKLTEIRVKAEEDRKTIALKAQYEEQAKYIDITANIMNSNNSSIAEQTQAKNYLDSKLEISKQDLERQRLISDNYNKAADRNVKREDIQSKERIAKTNKNKYDK